MTHAIATRSGTDTARRLPTTRRRGVAVAAGALVLAFTALAPTAASARPVPGSFADMAAKVTPAVVNISAERIRQTAQQQPRQGVPGDPRAMPFPEGSPFREFFRRYYNGPRGDRPQMPGQRPQTRRAKALGSGFIVDPDGYVVTNNHVIRGASRIEVILHDGKKYDAKLIGTDSRTDLALLKITADRKFPSVKWGDSNKARVGDWILAVGNPFGLGGTVTAGIVSARGRNISNRTIVDFLQIDAPINRGNSGGPTFNMDGDVVGVNTAIYSPNGGSIGLGFAIPSNLAKQVIDELRTSGKISRGWLGVQIQPVTDDIAKALKIEGPKGALVSAVVPESPAAKAGLQSGDVILRWDGKTVASVRDLVRKVSATKTGSTVDVELLRDGSQKTITVNVGANQDGAQRAGMRRSPNAPAPAAVGKLGLGLANLTPETRQRFNVGEDVAKGALVLSVRPDSPAAEKGLRPGDVITRVGNTEIASADQVAKAVDAATKAGREALLIRVVRDGTTRYLGLPLKS
ncbi:MAG: DegQ family serine endoprotease [Bauldia litoralis]